MLVLCFGSRTHVFVRLIKCRWNSGSQSHSIAIYPKTDSYYYVKKQHLLSLPHIKFDRYLQNLRFGLNIPQIVFFVCLFV